MRRSLILSIIFISTIAQAGELSVTPVLRISAIDRIKSLENKIDRLTLTLERYVSKQDSNDRAISNHNECEEKCRVKFSKVDWSTLSEEDTSRLFKAEQHCNSKCAPLPSSVPGGC